MARSTVRPVILRPPNAADLGMSTPELVANCRSFWLGFNPAGYHSESDGIVLYHSGVPGRMYNGVLQILPGAPVDAAVRAAKRTFRRTPWVWWVGPDSPATTADSLLAAGAQEISSFTVMALDVSEEPSVTIPGGLTLTRPDGETGIASWVGAYAPRFGVHRNSVEALTAAWRRRRDLSGALTRFVAGDGRQIVGTAALLDRHGIAGIYMVTTAPAFLRRGVATALTAAALALGYERGLRVATVQATAAGAAVYERLGFTAVTGYRLFVFPRW